MNRIIFPFPAYPMIGDVTSQAGNNKLTVTGLENIPLDATTVGNPPDLAVIQYSADNGFYWASPFVAISAGGFVGVLKKSANYTTSSGDLGYLITFTSNSSPVVTPVLTLPNPAPVLSPSWWILVENRGTGSVTINPNGLNIDDSASNLTLSSNQGVFLTTDGTNYYTERGTGSGGGSGVTSFTGDGILINNVSSTGNVTVSLGNATKYQFWGRNSGTTGTPNYFNLPTSTFALATDSNGQVIAATRSGNTSTLGTTSGTLTSGHVAAFDANGNIVDGGSPSGGTVTSVSGVSPVASTGGTTPAISLQNSASINITAALGTDTKYFTASGSAATNGNIITGNAQGGITDSGTAIATLKKGCAVFTFDGVGSTPSTNNPAFVPIPYGFTITKWELLANVSGTSASASITVKKATYAAYPTLTTIDGGSHPSLSSSVKNTDSTLSGWTTTGSAGDYLYCDLTSASGCTKLVLTIYLTRT